MSNIITYEPDNSLKKGYLSIFREIVHEFKESRWLTYQLFRRNFFGTYKQSFGGIFWAFIIPFISIGTFIILNRSGIFAIGDIDAPYPIYALLGMAFWQIFSTGLTASASSLARAGGMITRINFSKKSLVFAAIGKSILIFLIQCILIGLLFGLYRMVPSKGILLAPLVLIPLLLFMIGLGFILSLFNAFVKDVGNGLSVFMTFLMFLTPVLYAKPKVGILMHITKYNPLYYMISAARDLVLKGRICEATGFAISTVASVLIFFISLTLFHLTETRITERI